MARLNERLACHIVTSRVCSCCPLINTHTHLVFRVYHDSMHGRTSERVSEWVQVKHDELVGWPLCLYIYTYIHLSIISHHQYLPTSTQEGHPPINTPQQVLQNEEGKQQITHHKRLNEGERNTSIRGIHNHCTSYTSSDRRINSTYSHTVVRTRMGRYMNVVYFMHTLFH